MAYTQNMPQANQRINDTQPLIRDNFNEIFQRFGINHVNFNIAGAGKHALVTWPQSGAGLALANNEMKIYNALYAVPGTNQSELYVQRQDNAGVLGAAVPFTAGTQLNDGYAYLASGLFMRYGRHQTDGAAQFVVDFMGTGPQFSAQSYVALGLVDLGGGPQAVSLTYNWLVNWSRIQFHTRDVVGAAAPNAPFSYIIIGF
jgi:hypothetical protein